MQIPDNIDLNNPGQYILSVRISSNMFGYSLYDKSTRKVCFGETPFSTGIDNIEAFQQIIYDSEFLVLPYLQTNVVYVSKDYDLVPTYIIQKDKKEALYNFTHYLPAKHILYSSENIQQISTTYNVESELYEFLARSLHAPEFYHHSHVLMLYLEELNKEQGKKSKMYLNFHDKLVDVFCYDEYSQILHAITLDGQNEKNVLYFILNIWAKCGFSQQNDSLILLEGAENINLHIPSILSEYIKNIEHIIIPGKLGLNQQEIIEGDKIPLDLLILSAR